MSKNSMVIGVAGWGLALLLSGMTCRGQGLEVRTDDGLALNLTEHGWVSAISVNGKPLPRPGEARGGFTLLDVEAHRASLEKAGNLLPNGSFELDEDGNNLPDGWEARKADGKWSWDTAVARTGKHAMKVTLGQMEKPGVSGNLLPARRMPVKPQQEYRLSFWVKTENCGGKYPPTVYVRQFDAEGKMAVPQRGIGTKKGTNDWFQRAVEFRISPNTVNIDVYANIYRSHGTVWFDDFRLISLKTRAQARIVPTSLRKSDNGIGAAHLDEEAGLRLAASYLTKPGRIRVDIEVEDLRQTHRRVIVGYVIPLDASGWTWWDNICYKRRVTEPTIYRWTCRTEMGDGALSIYPFNSLGNGDVALTLGVPLDQGPRIWNAGYDHTNKQLFINFHLGISQVTTKFPGKATCSFILYRHDPVWGMRAAAKRFYEFYPQHFLKRFPFEAHMNYANLARLDSDTGAISYKYGRGSKTGAEDGSDLGESIPWFVAEHGGYHGAKWPGRGPETPPTDDEVRAHLTSKGDARSLAQITHDHNGAIRYHRKEHGGRYAPKEGGWFFELRVHEDPEIGDWVPRRVKGAWERWRKQHPDLPPFHVKMSSDEIMGYTGTGRGPDYRVDHLPCTDVPLGFHKDSLVLGRVNLSYDLLKSFYWPDSQQKKYLITGNANWFNRSFCCPYVDCGMVEWEWDRSDPLRTGINARMMCFQKLWRFWRVLRHGKYAEKDPEAVRLHFHRCMHWAIYPAGLYALDAGGRTGHHDAFRHLYRRYEPIVETLSGSGWEPITHARSSDDKGFVERYGYFDRGSLHFAVRNTSKEDRSVGVTADTQALGMAMDHTLRCWDLTTQRPVPVNREAEQVTLSLRIPPGEARVVHLADSRGRWLMALEQARRGIDRIERHYWKQTRGKDEVPAAEKALAHLRAAFEADQGNAAGLANATNALYVALETFRTSLRVSGTINRDKMFYRVLDEFSPGPGELLGVDFLPPNDWPGVRKGRPIEVTGTVRNLGANAVSDIKIALECPFPDASLTVLDAPRTLASGASAEARFRFVFAPDTPRDLAPVLLRLTARSGAATCTACRVLDIGLLRNAQLSLLPLMLNPVSEAQKMTLTVANPHTASLDGGLSIALPDGWDVREGKQTISVPASGTRKARFSVVAPKDAADGKITVTVELKPNGDPVERREFTVSVRGNRPRVVLPRLLQAPRIDGTIEPDAWRGAAEVSDFTVLNRPKRADVRTRVQLGLHDDSLYIGFRCDEPLMNDLRAAVTKEGDRVWSDDSIEVWLAPSHVSKTQFILNPIGTRGGTVTLGWTGAAKRLSNAWEAEMRIPLRELSPELSGAGEIWGIQFCRSRKAGGPTVNSTWSPSRAGFSRQEYFGDMVFE